ncbi:DgyrCDS1029 [Dimorphilus gyrociliatus]|uniref:DgyrCDS1029 n=1 Tax=Dimorphilus gyrociliatus TaxID=2664684 RepID=A0A7I8V8X3_9ANNE|nr:DgyrCDS1029 [Dimorphilus gyrociliatus]
MDQAVIVIIVLSAILSILLILLIIIILRLKKQRQLCFRNNKKKRKKRTVKHVIAQDNPVKEYTDPNLNDNERVTPVRDNLDHRRNLSEKGKNKLPTRIKAEALFQYVKENTIGLIRQFQDIPFQFSDLSSKAFERAENKAKNKYLNIKPYDQTRVILKTNETEIERMDTKPNYNNLSNLKTTLHNDYINANFITGYNNSSREYVASQGTKENTEVDFWRMVSTLKSNRIVMLTKCVESSLKCTHYWPKEFNKAESYGHINVTLEKEDEYADFTVRTFKLHEDDNETEVRQYHYTAWPDKGVPEFPTSLLEFREFIRKQDDIYGNASPLIVHCSAGVGRTGTFILIDSMLKMQKKENYVDLFKFLYQMRRERMYLIQTDEQYIFAYNSIVEKLETGDTAIKMEDFKRVYSQLVKNFDSPDQSSILHGHFNSLKKLRPAKYIDIHEAKMHLDGFREENKAKNRRLSLLPQDRYRPCLQPMTGRTNYINAIRLDGSLHKNTFIITQAPMKDTIIDFYRLVIDSASSVVVMLNEINNEDCPQYWPEQEGDHMEFGPITVKLLEQEVNFNSTIIFSKLEISQTENERIFTTTVDHYRFTNWPGDNRSDDSVVDLARLINLSFLTHDNKKRIKLSPIIVHCLHGTIRSGVFATAALALEKMKVNREVDIFHSSKLVLGSRPQTIDSAVRNTLPGMKYLGCLIVFLLAFCDVKGTLSFTSPSANSEVHLTENNNGDAASPVTISFNLESNGGVTPYTYSIVSGGDSKFEIDTSPDPDIFRQKSGALFDYETTSSYTIELKVIDSTGGTSLTASVTFTVIVDDWNDETPQLGSASYTASVDESQDPGAAVTLSPTISSSDGDAIDNGNLRYSLTGADSTYFQINAVNGILKTSSILDADPSGKTYTNVKIVVTDLAGKTSTAAVTVTVNDLNDVVPTCDPSVYYASINENTAVSTSLLQFSCTDTDNTASFKALTFSITSGDDTGSEKFQIANTNELHTTTTSCDYEDLTQQKYTLAVTVKDATTNFNSVNITAIININPINDNTPTWSSTPTGGSFYENQTIGEILTTLQATDTDKGANGDNTLSYHIISATTQTSADSSALFKIDPITGNILTVASLDKDTGITEHRLVVKAQDDGTSPGIKSVTASITYTILDYNEFQPTFDKTIYTVSINENTNVGTTIQTLTATDQDDTSAFTFSFGTGNELDHFEITTSSNNGHVKIKSTIDPDGGSPPSFYTLQVKVTDGSSTPAALTSTATIQISILDINDNNPSFSPAPAPYNLPENTPAGTTIITLVATDDDFNSELTFSEGTGDTNDNFAIQSDGKIVLLKQIDYDTMGVSKIINLQAIVSDGSNTATATAQITVTDVSDLTPSCNPAAVSANISETASVNDAVVQLSCSDDGSLTYSIASGNTNTAFKFVSNEIQVNDIGAGSTALDYDAGVKVYNLIVDVSDGTNTINVPVTISINPVDEGAPTFTNTAVNVNENEVVGFSVATFAASDVDASPHNVQKYSITSGNSEGKFVINPSTGEVSLKDTLDYETTTTYALTIQADDGTATGSGILTVNVQDINDNTPSCPKSLYIPTAVNENEASDTLVLNLTECSDPDTSSNFGSITMSITGDNGRFAVSNMLIKTTSTPLDYESATTYTLIITLTDNGGVSPSNTGTVTAIVNVAQ